MLRNVALKLVRDQRRALIWWSLGLVALTALTVALYPSIRDSPELNQTVADLPEALRELTVGSESDFTSPAGYLNSRLFALMAPLLLTIYAINLGTGAIAGEEERRTLDLLLSTPVSRRWVVLQKCAGIAAVVAALTGAFWLALWIGARAAEMGIGAGSLAAAAVASALFAVVIGALAFALGCVTGRRAPSLAISAAVAAASYLLNGLAMLVDWLEPARWVSPFYLALGQDPLREGLSVGGTVALVAMAAVLVGVGLAGFERRDVAV
jgi:ABC-2 type transport system permease protein